MNTIGKFGAAALLTLSGMSLALPAHAIPALRLTATGTVSATQTITDNDTNDANASDGIVAYSGAVGDFSFTSSVGVTKPVLGASVVPKMDILSIQIGGGSPTSMISIEFTETDFFANGPFVGFPSLIGGTANGTIRYQTFASLSNSQFAKDIAIADSGILGPGAFSFSDLATIALQGDFSLTTVVTVTHGANFTNSSFNATVEIAEPGLISMISLSGLMFAAGISARRRQRNR